MWWRKIANPAYQSAMIPANTYDGQTDAVPTVAITNILVTREDVPDEVAYQMTKLLFENLTRLGTSHSAAKDITLKKTPRKKPADRTPPRCRALLQGSGRAVTPYASTAPVAVDASCFRPLNVNRRQAPHE
nr:hypothetical protein GCM10020185_65560 [Pseudomonas brassicacearum subsp. brassicacearum]